MGRRIYRSARLEIRDYASAAVACRAALLTEPHADAYANLAAAFIHLHRTDEVLDATRAALALDPSHAQAANNLGIAHKANERSPKHWQRFSVRSNPDRKGHTSSPGQPAFRSLPMWDGTSSSAHLLIWQETLSDRKASPVMRAAQLFFSFCANNAVIGDAHECRNIALTNYANMATAEAGRPFLRAKLYDAPAFFNATDCIR